MPNKRLIAFFIAAVGCIGCGQQIDNNHQELLIEGLERAGQFMRDNNKERLSELTGKRVYLATKW